MIENDQVDIIKKTLQRIFSFPVTNSTYKEVQSTIYNVLNQDKDKTNEVLQALLTGNSDQENGRALLEIINQFSIPVRVSKDVLEKGEFINFMSSDLLRQGNRALFTNHVRRVDGEHFQFFAEPDGIIRLIEHFTGRLEEIGRLDKSKKFLKTHMNELASLRDRMEKLAE